MRHYNPGSQCQSRRQTFLPWTAADDDEVPPASSGEPLSRRTWEGCHAPFYTCMYLHIAGGRLARSPPGRPDRAWMFPRDIRTIQDTKLGLIQALILHESCCAPHPAAHWQRGRPPPVRLPPASQLSQPDLTMGRTRLVPPGPMLAACRLRTTHARLWPHAALDLL